MNKKNLILAAALAAFSTPAAFAGDDAAVSQVSTIEVAVSSALINENPTMADVRRGAKDAPFPVSRDEAAFLATRLADTLEAELGSSSLYNPQAGSDRGAKLRVVIEDVVPGAVQYTDAGFRSGAFRGEYGRGGATLSAALIAADGTVIEEYRYEEIQRARYGENSASAWADADASLQRFAQKLAEELEEQG